MAGRTRTVNASTYSPKLKLAEKKRKILDMLADGVGVEDACLAVGTTAKSHEYYMRTDPDYRATVLAIRVTQGRRGETVAVPEFAAFRETYLGRKTFWHQHQWIDVLEGREPRDLHPAEIYQPGDPSLVLINTPPHHAKSQTITCDYVVWRLCKDPNSRIVIVSQTREMARQWMYQVKTILTHPRYAKLQADFAPTGGFKADADTWSADKIYFGQGVRDSGQKDPTLQCLGMGQQIYGARSDLIVLDDCVVLANAGEYEKQINWITQEVVTRPGADGAIVVVGTRVAPQDLYSELRNPSRYEDDESSWTYFAQPALLEPANETKDWKTLWPRTDQRCDCRRFCKKGDIEPDENGLYAKWDGPHLAQLRGKLANRSTWARVYQQQDVAADQVFKPENVANSVNGLRVTGPLIAGAYGHPRFGMEGHYKIGSMDPAAAGFTASVVYSIDRGDNKRYVLDVHNQAAMTPLAIRQHIQFWTVKYQLNEWRIEDNAFQSYLARDQELATWLASRGCVLNPHHTGKNKWDEDFGVMAMAPLFGEVVEGKEVRAPLIELPSPKQNEAVKQLIEQLVVWQPKENRGKTTKTDIVMALWFAELRAREILAERTYGGTHLPNKYTAPYQKRQQISVNLDDAWAARNVPQGDYVEVPPLSPSLPGPWRRVL